MSDHWDDLDRNSIRAAEAKFGVGHPRHGEAALGDLEPWQMEALAADLRHLFATGRNPQLDDLDDLCPHCGATKGVCGDAGHRERSLPLHRTEAGWPRCATCDGGGCFDCTDPS
jgi:hypothetical protein